MDCQKLQNLCTNICDKQRDKQRDKQSDKQTTILMSSDNIYLPVSVLIPIPIKLNSDECLQMKEVYNICCNKKDKKE